jgi:hypothetical protein
MDLMLQIPKNIYRYQTLALLQLSEFAFKNRKKLVQNEKIINFRFLSGCLLRVLNPIIRMECSEYIYIYEQAGQCARSGKQETQASPSQEEFTLEKMYAKLLENLSQEV